MSYHAQATERRRRKRATVVPGATLDQWVMGILNTSHGPLSAYDLLDCVAEIHARSTPTAIYRSLDRLAHQGWIERVESLSAYRTRDVADALLLACNGCGTTVALSAADEHSALRRLAADAGFDVGKLAVEAVGRCRSCSVGEVSDGAEAASAR